MHAMILAAGLGTRLAPLTDYLPKPMFPVVGVPNIIRIIHLLRRADIRNIVINLHHFPEMIQDALGNGEQFGVSIRYSPERELLGTAGGIRRALDFLGDETLVVINADTFFIPDIRGAVGFHKKMGALATLVIRADPRAESYGAVGLDGRGKVVRLAWATSDNLPESIGMFTGVHVLEPGFARNLPDVGCIVREVYMPLVKEEAPIYGFRNDGWFFDLGTPKSYLDANLSLLEGRIHLSGFSAPEKGVFLGSDVHLGEECRLLPGAILGNRVRVNAGVCIERAVIFDDTRVERDVCDAICFSDLLVSAK